VASGVGEVVLHCAPDATHPFFVRCARELGVALETQVGADLGERMQRAFDRAFARGEALIAIGSDCPALGSTGLRRAREALRTHDAVLVPAEDGGYALMGLSRPLPGIFAGVDWGTGAVLAQTRERLERSHGCWQELETLWDVDRPEDYARLEREGLVAGIAR
jgi:rSAM/selenodomain-associated transferase 1